MSQNKNIRWNNTSSNTPSVKSSVEPVAEFNKISRMKSRLIYSTSSILVASFLPYFHTNVSIVEGFSYTNVCGCSNSNDHSKLLFTSLQSTATAANTEAIFQIKSSILQQFRTGKSPYVVVKNALPDALVNELRMDAKALQKCGFGKGGGLGASQANSNRKGGDIRKNVHQTWLQSCGSNIKDTLPNDIERSKLLDAVENLRYDLVNGFQGDDQENLIKDLNLLSSKLVELSYLSYSPGSFYKRHIDVFSSHDLCSLRRQRVVSFLLYLGSDEEVDRDWEKKDGGALRIFEDSNEEIPSKEPDESQWRDILPRSGTLVLFDSQKVPHEVLETKRSRRCVVGWLNVPK